MEEPTKPFSLADLRDNKACLDLGKIMTKTLDHYNKTAQQYAEINHALPTAYVDVDRFVAQLLAQPNLPTDRPLKLLDAGSGSGRDTLAFLKHGFQVDAFDGSESMAEISTHFTGQATKVMRFEELDLPDNHYDAVWAQASLLHVPRDMLPQVLVDLGKTLKPGGLLFASFKYGSGERYDERDGREFTDINEDHVEHLLQATQGFDLVNMLTRDPPTEQTNAAAWFSMMLKRNGLELKLNMTPVSGSKIKI